MTTRYLIVGGGMAAHAAIEGIRELDQRGAILLIGAEMDPPYARPPLSKGLWKGEPLAKIRLDIGNKGATMLLGRSVASLDTGARTVTDTRGNQHNYDKLLLATGGTPRRLPFGGDDIIYFRTLGDYQRLRAVADQHGRVTVIGGGFIGSEIAAALAMNGCKVTMMFPENGIGARVFPADLSQFLVGYYREKGVEVKTGATVTSMEQLDADAVVAGLGITPNTQLAESAGLIVKDGIVIDQRLATSNPDVFAAGDVARFEAPGVGSMRVEHEDNAVTMGKAAGRSMAGDTAPYRHLPFFYSDLFDLGYEAVGELDSRMETKADWKTPFREGIIEYRRDGKLRGALLWNVFGRVDEYRELIGR